MPIMRLAAFLSLTTVAVACQDAGQKSVALLQPGNSYAVTRIDGAPAPAGITFDLGAGGRVTGRGPCNRYSGQLTARDGAMTISGLVTTRMACADPARAQAQARLDGAMIGVTAARRSTDGISLIDPEGRERIGMIPAGR